MGREKPHVFGFQVIISGEIGHQKNYEEIEGDGPVDFQHQPVVQHPPWRLLTQ